MPRDLLNIAIEHHRAGRLRQAEEGYRALLARSPEDAEALHLLGVLAQQVDRPGDAVTHLEKAATLRPTDAAIPFNLGHAYGQCGQMDLAIDAFARSLELEPGRAATMVDLGLALLKRQRSGDAERAIGLLWQVLATSETGSRTAVVQHGLSVGLLVTGQIEQSINAARAAIASKSEYAAAHYQLGLALAARRDLVGARQSLTKAIELRQGPGGGGGAVESVAALAMLEVEAGNLARAETLFRRLVTDDPAYAPAWRGLGQVLTRQGRHAEALSAMAEAVRAARTAPAPPTVAAAGESLSSAATRATNRLTPSSEAAELHFALATEASVVAPSRVPAAVVTELFDRYAPRFDEHLRDKLAYRVPERIAEMVARLKAPEAESSMDILDIGCGTGLCGMLLRPMAKSLAGVDLSPAMIEQTRKRGVYDQLHVGDLLETLSAADCQYDLIVAADVLIYHGDLSQIFESAQTALRPGGLFVFSIESSSADRYTLQPNRRYGHSRGYIDRLIAMYDWERVAIEDIAIREEKRQTVAGFLAALRRR